jgi:hypothetical protein
MATIVGQSWDAIRSAIDEFIHEKMAILPSLFEDTNGHPKRVSEKGLI